MTNSSLDNHCLFWKNNLKFADSKTMIANQFWNLKNVMVIQAVFFHIWKYYDKIHPHSKLLKWCCNLNFEWYSDWTLKLRLWWKEALSQWKKNQTSNALADWHKEKHSTFWWWEKTFKLISSLPVTSQEEWRSICYSTAKSFLSQKFELQKPSWIFK